MKSGRPSIRDVARACGTSISTVSAALNDRRGVSPQMRERVRAAACELGYAANPLARGMKGQSARTIGVIVTDLSCIFFHPILKGIGQALTRNGYAMFVCETNYSPEQELERLGALQSGIVDGMILATAAQCHADAFAQRALRPAQGRVPIVSIETNLNKFGVDSVLVDNQGGALAATRHLLDLGCRRILHIGGPPSIRQCIQRRQGYRDALMQAGVPWDERLVADGDFSAESGDAAVRRALAAGLHLDGIFAANDQMAAGALRALREARIAVPERVKVAGFDDTFICSVATPPLTTVRVPKYEMGRLAAELLLERIRCPEKEAAAARLDFRLIVRASTDACAAPEPPEEGLL